MKKRNLIILSAVVIAVLLVFTMFYPPADESDSAGTIGKVDKYRNSQTEQDNIILRNELLKDTTALKATIAALDYYEVFLTDMAKDFKDWDTSLKETNIKDLKLEEQLKDLNLLVTFMTNNLSVVSDTKILLSKYFTKDTLNMSIDIQNNLMQFGNFINNLAEKDKVIDSLFINFDGMLKEDKIKLLAGTKEQAEKLIAIREKMLGPILFYALAMGNESRLNAALNSQILNVIILNRVINNKLGIWANEGGLNAVKNPDQLNALFSKDALGPISFPIILNKDNNQAIVFTASMAAELKNKTLGPFMNMEKLGIDNKGGLYCFSKPGLGNNPVLNSSFYNQSSFGQLGIFARSLNNMMGNMSRSKLGPFI